MMPVHHRLCKQHPCVRASFNHELRFPCIQRDGLLAEYMLARLSRLNRPFLMKVIGKRNVHRLHIAVLKQLLVAAVSLLHLKLVR
ncbi:hypothetical protein D3C81_1321500 [compost metagenome]